MDKVIRLLPLLYFLIFLGCSSWSKEQQIVDAAIEAHGGDLFQKVRISFDFRERHYTILKNPSRFEYSREFTDSTGLVLDVLNNEGFVRTINGKEVAVTEERKRAFSNSVNSVAYFAFLPYGLNDPAAKKSWFAETELEGQTYDIIKVTFDEEGGGDDFEDEFMYWINRENSQLDYLAYSFHTEGGGVRFRKAVNSRMVDGIRIQDYENYMPADKATPLEEMESLYKSDELKLLSEILLENVEVEVIE
jgi:hypothetical protein